MIDLHKKLALRRLRRNKYIWINIFGLSLGIAVFMILSLFIQNENSYEKEHVHLNNIYRLEQTRKDGDAVRKMCGTPPPLSLVIDKDIAGIKKCTRMTGQHSGVIRQEDGTKTTVNNIIFADKAFLEIFTYPVIHGAPYGNLDQPFMAIITKEYSNILFGTEYSTGRKIRYDNDIEIEIQSVVEQLSDNSHLNFSILISFETLVSIAGEEIINQDWDSNWPHNYVLLDGKTSPETVNSNLDEYLKKYQGESSENRLYLKPLKDIHLRSDVVDEFAQTGSYQNNIIYMIIAIMIILIACINYINLTIAYSAARIKEIGIRKVIGANRKNLIGQLMGESSISILLSMFIALILIELFIPFFNTLINRNLYVNYQENWQFAALFVSISLGLGLITGLLPAKTLSGFQPLSMARKVMLQGKKGLYFRYGLVLFQFFITISLISGTLTIFKQYSFLKNKDLGYNKDQVVIMNLANPHHQKLYQYKTELEKLPGIEKVDCSDYLPMNSTNWTMFTWEGAAEDEYMKMNINYIGSEFTDVYDIELVGGEGFRPELADREQMYVLLNETAVKEMGWKDDPIGKEIMWQVDYRTRNVKKAKVVGIAKDFHYLSKHQAIRPLIMPLLNLETTGGTLSVNISSGNLKAQIENISQVFKKIYPDELFNFQFANEVVNNLYQTEQKMTRLVLSLTFIAITIAIMGLVGLVSYTANQKTKEIGIRKVNGASAFNIVKLLSIDFTRLLILGFIISCPVSLFVMKLWLQNFAYQTSISWWIFIMTLSGILIISFVSIGFQTIKAASQNPVEALRYE